MSECVTISSKADKSTSMLLRNKMSTFKHAGVSVSHSSPSDVVASCCLYGHLLWKLACVSLILGRNTCILSFRKEDYGGWIGPQTGTQMGSHPLSGSSNPCTRHVVFNVPRQFMQGANKKLIFISISLWKMCVQLWLWWFDWQDGR